MNKYVCLYARTARKNQEAINLQIKIIKDFANKNGFRNLKVFADNGVSGLNVDRKGFQGLLELIKSDKVSTLIVKNTSRLGRSFVDAQNLMYTTLPKYNVRLISIDDGIDSEKDEDEFMPIKNIINKWYEENKSSQKNKLFAK